MRTPSGIVAIAGRKEVTAAEICAPPDALRSGRVDVQDPGNVGALLRAAEAGGVTGAFVCGVSANPFSWKALRGSMGSALRLPIVGGMTTHQAMTAMREVVRANGGGGAARRTAIPTPSTGAARSACCLAARVPD